MPGYSIWIVLVLAVWAYIGVVTWLGPGLWWYALPQAMEATLQLNKDSMA